MIIDARGADYVSRVIKRIEEHRASDAWPTVCPECNRMMDLGTESDHLVYRLPNTVMVVIIGCEGYWCINPVLVGLARGNWLPA